MRILIADDHELMRRGIRSVLLNRSDFMVCGEATDGQDAIQQAHLLNPDLILMDISMPRLNGLEATREIRRTLPQVEILVLSQHNSPEMMRQALNAGARGYVVKSAISANLVMGIEKISRGELFFEAAAAAGNDARVDLQDILQRSQTFERELRESEERFRLTFEHAAVGIAHVAKDGHWLRVNEKVCQILGYSQQELRKLTFQAVTHPADLAANLSRQRKVASGDTDQYSMEKRYIRKDRTSVWINVTVSAVRDSDRNLKYFVTVVEDISARKRTAEALGESETRLTAEATALAKLNDWSSRLWHIRDLEEGLQEMLSAVIELLGADKGIVQLLNPAGDKLRIVAQHSFDQNFLDFFRDVSAKDRTASGRALLSARPVVIDDVELDEEYAPFRPAARAAGYRSVISSPMNGLDGRPMGVLSTHFVSPHRPSDQELRRLDLYTRQAADFIQRVKTDETLRRNEDRLRALSERLDAKVRARTKELEDLNADVLRQSEQLRQLSWQLLLAEDEERRHIARELHDSAGQTLAVLSMNLATIVEGSRLQTPDVAQKAQETQELVEQLAKEIRTTSYLLHPPLLDENGLAAALSWYVRGLAERSGLDIKLDISEEFGRLASALEMVVFRLVQECLANVHRHSGSSTASIQIVRDPARIVVEIRDQGKGISPEKMAEIQSGGSGVGIRGMRERLRQFQGEMTIDSTASGTTISVTIPVSQNARQALPATV